MIYANQLLRAAYPAMRQTAETILQSGARSRRMSGACRSRKFSHSSLADPDVVPPAEALAAFERAGVTFWSGVPDSLLASFCRCIEESSAERSHVIAANEGGAIAVAAGHHLATGEVCGAYLQNSGLGNAINPLVSLADPAVYGIQIVLLIGWRGEPGTRDEPQHARQGETTIAMLEAIGVPARVVSTDIGVSEPMSTGPCRRHASGAGQSRWSYRREPST